VHERNAWRLEHASDAGAMTARSSGGTLGPLALIEARHAQALTFYQ
jgi:hypothetical protein